LNVFLTTLDWRAIPLLLVNVLIAGAIYLPFVRMYEQMELAKS
jgi:cellobiose-specific phosphotransferase system component IIC